MQKFIDEKIMESRLIVKNFGPIKEVNLDLRNVNVFIGPQSTGKSALAKIYTIFKAPRKFFYKIDPENKILNINNEKALKEFEEVLIEYNIHSFLKEDSEIEFESDLHNFTYKNGTIEYVPKLFNTIKNIEELYTTDFNNNKTKIIEGLKELANSFIFFNIRALKILAKDEKTPPLLSDNYFDNIDESNSIEVFDMIKNHEADLSTNTALYIPAERNFINIIKKSALNLILNKVPIPKHILSFGAELEKLSINEIDLSFIQGSLVYKNIDGEDRIYFNNNESIMLTEAASGIQSVVPILSAINNKKTLHHRSFVIEEPELNLFPTAQYELIQQLELNRLDPNPSWSDFGSIHTYTTHSPYVLSALNNLLYANKVKSILNQRSMLIENISLDDLLNKTDAKIKAIVKADIKPESFTAYQIKNGYAELIFNRETGLIDDNFIDESSDILNDDFDKLMELTK